MPKPQPPTALRLIESRIPADRAELIGRYFTYCRSKHLSERTITTYAWALRKLPDPVPLSIEPLEAQLATLELSRESVRDVHRVWRQVYKWASRQFGIPNVMAELKAPRKARGLPRVFTASELTAIWAACGSGRDRAMVGVALGTGARVGEIWSLRRSRIRGDVAEITGKTGSRIVPISGNLTELLDGLGGGDHIWTGKTGPLTFPGFKMAFKRILERARLGGSKLGPHTFRHTFATEYIRAGGNAFALQGLLGHADIESTQIYVHLAARDLVRNMEGLSPLRLVLGNQEEEKDRSRAMKWQANCRTVRRGRWPGRRRTGSPTPGQGTGHRANYRGGQAFEALFSLARSRTSGCEHRVQENKWSIRRSDGCVDLERCKPLAHGRIVITQECQSCGAVRRINLGPEQEVAVPDIDRIEYGPWLPACW